MRLSKVFSARAHTFVVLTIFTNLLFPTFSIHAKQTQFHILFSIIMCYIPIYIYINMPIIRIISRVTDENKPAINREQTVYLARKPMNITYYYTNYYHIILSCV